MIEKSKNKAIGAADAENKAAPAAPSQEYHFAGGGKYEPQTVTATSYGEALKEWERTRKKVEPPQIIN